MPTAKLFSRSILLACLFFSVGGCIKILAQASDEPSDLNHGKRTWGAYIEDQAIENKLRYNIYQADEKFAAGRIIVVSMNGVVLIAGQVENKALKDRATRLAKKVRHVKRVENELSLSGPISFLAKRSDDFISAKLKIRLLFSSGVPGRRVKIKTENGIVYLMGLVSKEEGQRIAASAQKTYGVQRIVKIFEYI